MAAGRAVRTRVASATASMGRLFVDMLTLTPSCSESSTSTVLVASKCADARGA